MIAWIFYKISNYLRLKEGFIIEKEGYLGDTQIIILRDVFGYRYELTISTLGKIHSHESDYVNSMDDFKMDAHNPKYENWAYPSSFIWIR